MCLVVATLPGAVGGETDSKPAGPKDSQATAPDGTGLQPVQRFRQSNPPSFVPLPIRPTELLNQGRAQGFQSSGFEGFQGGGFQGFGGGFQGGFGGLQGFQGFQGFMGGYGMGVFQGNFAGSFPVMAGGIAGGGLGLIPRPLTNFGLPLAGPIVSIPLTGGVGTSGISGIAGISGFGGIGGVGGFGGLSGFGGLGGGGFGGTGFSGGGFAHRPGAPLAAGGGGFNSPAVAPDPRTFAPPPAGQLALSESAVPEDRVFFYSNYTNTLGRGFEPGLGRTDYYVETIGFEKTLLDGQASVGMRLPFNNVSASGGPNTTGIGETEVGDLTLSGKYAFYCNKDTGALLSTGMLVSVPTSSGHLFHKTVFLEPFLGYILNGNGCLYLQGFLSLVLPTDERYESALLNDIQLGYFLYRSCDPDKIVSSVVPIFEVHVITPVEHANTGVDVVDLTGGVAFGLGTRSSMVLAVEAPVTHPRPYNYAVLAQFNLHF
jgi:hypothetical protein